MQGRITDWGEFRFSIIGGLLANPPKHCQLRQELEKLSSQQYLHPTKECRVSFSLSTIERWYYKALKSDNPVQALGRKVRKDFGESKAMNLSLLEVLHNQYKSYPHWSYQLHADNLEVCVEQEPGLGKTPPSYSTVQRRMKERGWVKKYSPAKKTKGQILALDRLENLEVRSFEAEYVNALWHLDFHRGRRVLDANGQWHTPQVLCILDDRSRLCCHIQWYLDETADTLIHGLCQAFVKRGLPRSLMTDNGSAMIADETQSGLLKLGIMHDKTLPYSPYQNGKQERFWSQLEGRLMAMLSNVENLSLDFLNRATQAWVEQEYNRAENEDLASSPIKVVLAEKDVSRPSPDEEKFHFSFTRPDTRKQRKTDGTIKIKGVRYEIPSRYRHIQKFRVRYQDWDLSKAYLVDSRTDEKFATIYPQDKTKNASGKRRALEVIQKSSSETNKNDSLPPLLKKIMAEYAATGLPPAYLPKNNESRGESE